MPILNGKIEGGKVVWIDETRKQVELGTASEINVMKPRVTGMSEIDRFDERYPMNEDSKPYRARVPNTGMLTVIGAMLANSLGPSRFAASGPVRQGTMVARLPVDYGSVDMGVSQMLEHCTDVSIPKQKKNVHRCPGGRKQQRKQFNELVSKTALDLKQDSLRMYKAMKKQDAERMDRIRSAVKGFGTGRV